MLRELGCEYGQGFFFSGAIDRRAASAWMDRPPVWS